MVSTEIKSFLTNLVLKFSPIHDLQTIFGTHTYISIIILYIHWCHHLPVYISYTMHKSSLVHVGLVQFPRVLYNLRESCNNSFSLCFAHNFLTISISHPSRLVDALVVCTMVQLIVCYTILSCYSLTNSVSFYLLYSRVTFPTTRVSIEKCPGVPPLESHHLL